MSGSSFYFFYQQRGKEDQWLMALSQDRAKVLSQKPAFLTVLELTAIPEDNDWSKTRYRGPFYADFDAGDDLELVCDQFKAFLGRLDGDLGFDITQARLYASGSKGFHIEIPQECFIQKVPPTGIPWLAYAYRMMAEALFVETLDLNVYTGKRGRQWRVTNVERENGCYKVPISVEDALTITPEVYRELIKEPRPEPAITPPTTNAAFAMLFERSREKVVTMMRTKKKRSDKALALLKPWKDARKTPPSIEKIMSGEDLAPGAGFQAIAMQLSVYAASVEMPLAEFLERCQGLIENHVSDGVRYNTGSKRREELSRMWQYMNDNTLYDFEVGPMVRLLKQGTDTSDLGVMETEDRGDREADRDNGTDNEVDKEDGDETVKVDVHKRLRRGFFMNSEGMFRRNGDETDPICRATLRNVDAFYDVEKNSFMGYEFDIVTSGRKRARVMASAEVFTSAQNLRKFFAAYQISFQGSEADAAALMDVIAEKAERGGRVFVFPREGFFVVNHPDSEKPEPVMCYLTKDTFLSSIPKDDPGYFQLKYKPSSVTSAYDIDIHWAPDLNEDMASAVEDLFRFNKPTVMADLLGWFVAAHYRSLYLRLFGQFPMLQAYGEAGSGKTQSIKLMAHMHWHLTERIPIKTAMSFTPFALDAHASSSTSAPFIIDEYKPRELKSAKGKFEKLKDLFKAAYTGGDIGERGTVNKGAENTLALVKSKAVAPVVFLGEAIEMETAIIERSVCVPFSKLNHNAERRAAFERLQTDPTVLSAIGKAVVQAGFLIDLERMRKDFASIRAEVEARLPSFDDPARMRLAPRMIYNRAVVIHGLQVLKYVLGREFGTEFDERVMGLINARDNVGESEDEQVIKLHAMSEISKVVSRLALLSRERDLPYEMVYGKDYDHGDGWVEIMVERAYDKYRVYCAAVRDTPLFDSLEAFAHALNNYSPVIDRRCLSSTLRSEGSTEKVVRFSNSLLMREGVQTFRT